ncbi:MAG: extracellular solute-binding protein [Lachnospiraceae bacterium]|nr:extracellular solute-binding protein [Lachnospiraceae bacterium]
MKKRSMRLFALLLAAMMTCTACQAPAADTTTAAPGNQETKAPATETTGAAEATEPAPSWTNDDDAEITIMMVQSAVPGADDLVIAELEKRTGTKINMISVAGADYAVKLSSMIGAGNIPDIFEVRDLSDAQKYIDAGILANVEDLLTEVAPNVMEETKDVLYEIPVNDGGVYMVPVMSRSYAMNLNVRTDWLENLGMKMPTNLDEYKEMLRAFTEDDPDKNGEDDTYGLEFILDHVGQYAWVSVFGAYGIPAGKNGSAVTIELEDGTISTWVKHPRFIEAMTYIRSIVDAGYCEPDFVSVPAATSYEALWTGVAGVMEFQCVGPTNNWYPGRYTEDPLPTFDFPIIEGPYGDSGVAAKYVDYSNGFVFSSTCKNLEGAARIANYCMSQEGSELMTYGIEGVMWQWVDEANGKMEYLGEYTDSAVHRAAGGYCHRRLFVPSFHAELRTLNAQTQAGVQEAYDNAIEWAYIPYVSEVYTENGADMDQAIDEMMAELFTTTGDLQEVYDRWIEEWETLGGTEWEAELTEMWKEMNK